MATRRQDGSDPDQDQEDEVNLAVGIRFRPSDKELIGIYLFNEAIGGPSVTPCIKIPMLHVYGAEPWQLRSCVDTRLSVAGEFYCFTRLKRSTAGGRWHQRRTPRGYWRSNDRVDVLNDNDPRRPCIGYRTLLKFYFVDANDDGARSKKSKHIPTPWVMHEYRLRRRFWERTSTNADELVICKIKPKGSEGPFLPDDGAECSSHPMEARTDVGCSDNRALAVAVGSDTHTVLSCDSWMVLPTLVEISAMKGAAGPPDLDDVGGGMLNEYDSRKDYKKYVDDSSSSSCEPTASEEAAMDDLVSPTSGMMSLGVQQTQERGSM